MSADNWRDCPKCIARTNLERAKLAKEAQDSYGKVSSADYAYLLSKVDECKHPDSSMREYREIGITATGEFYVSYRASCDECGFSFNFKQEKQLQIRVQPMSDLLKATDHTNLPPLTTEQELAERPVKDAAEAVLVAWERWCDAPSNNDLKEMDELTKAMNRMSGVVCV